MMKKIPLNSIILLFGESTHWNNFPSYEVIDFQKEQTNLFFENQSFQAASETLKVIESKIRAKVKFGERVVLRSDFTNKSGKFVRLSITKIAKELGVQTFYLVDNIQNIEPDSRKYISRGDHIAEFVDLAITEIDIIQKLPGGDLLPELINRGFDGFTVIADVHGIQQSLLGAIHWATVRNRFIIFLGDIIDYGPKPFACMSEVHRLITNGNAALVMGNHEYKFQQWLGNKDHKVLSAGRKVTIELFQELSIDVQIQTEQKCLSVINSSRNHYIIGNVVLTHGAADMELFKLDATRLDSLPKLQKMCMYGQIDETVPWRDDGYPNRIHDWTNTIESEKIAIVGHDIRSTELPMVIDNDMNGKVIFLDTGCGKGGGLSSVSFKFIPNLCQSELECYNRH